MKHTQGTTAQVFPMAAWPLIFAGLILTALTLAALTLTARPARAEGNTMNTSTLTARQRGIVPIAAFTATGDMAKLDTALREGLDAGLTISEIKEVLVQLYAYAGFPRSLNGLAAFMAVLKDRELKGIKDEPGNESGPLPAGKSRLELGTEVQTKLVGAPVKGPLYDFAPAIDQFLKEHLFAHIFGRDALDWQSREIATISALASLDGTASQLRSHCRVGLNVGLSEVQLKTLAEVLAAKVGKKEAGNAATALGEVLESR